MYKLYIECLVWMFPKHIYYSLKSCNVNRQKKAYTSVLFFMDNVEMIDTYNVAKGPLKCDFSRRIFRMEKEGPLGLLQLYSGV